MPFPEHIIVAWKTGQPRRWGSLIVHTSVHADFSGEEWEAGNGDKDQHDCYPKQNHIKCEKSLQMERAVMTKRALREKHSGQP